MSSPAEQPYWQELLQQIPERSIADLAEQYDADPAEVDAALAATTGDRPVQNEAWWPEVLRDHEEGSLRRLARRFGTNPRRLRRGLARSAVRVGGSTIGDAGVVQLEAFRDRLGQEPDRTLAAEAGVTVEAIKGERRRLGIEPYRMKPDVEEWGGRSQIKREKPRQRRRWQEAPEPIVIRRADHGWDASADAVDAAEPETDLHETVGEARQDPTGDGYHKVEPAPGAGVAASPSLPRATGLPSLGFPPSPPGLPEASESDDASTESRRRRRLVRPTTPSDGSAGGEAEVFARLPRLGSKPPVRIIQPDEVELDQIEVPPAQTLPAREAKEHMRPKRTRAVKTSARQAPDPVAPAARPAPKAAKPAPTPAKPEAKPPTPASLVSAPIEEANSARLRSGPPIGSSADELRPLDRGTGLSEPGTAGAGSFAWQVDIPGQVSPVLVLAENKRVAIKRAFQHLGGEPVSGVVALRLGEVLDED